MLKLFFKSIRMILFNLRVGKITGSQSERNSVSGIRIRFLRDSSQAL